MTKTAALKLIRKMRKEYQTWKVIAATLKAEGFVGERSGKPLSETGARAMYFDAKRPRKRNQNRSAKPKSGHLSEIRKLVNMDLPEEVIFAGLKALLS